MMIPPFFTSCSSSGCTSTRSPRGLTLTAAIGFVYSLVCFLGYACDLETFRGRRQIVISEKRETLLLTFSCSRPRLRTPHRRRRLRACLRLLQRRRVVALQARVAD